MQRGGRTQQLRQQGVRQLQHKEQAAIAVCQLHEAPGQRVEVLLDAVALQGMRGWVQKSWAAAPLSEMHWSLTIASPSLPIVLYIK